MFNFLSVLARVVQQSGGCIHLGPGDYSHLLGFFLLIQKGKEVLHSKRIRTILRDSRKHIPLLPCSFSNLKWNMLLKKPLCLYTNIQFKRQVFAFYQLDAISPFPKFIFPLSSIPYEYPSPIASLCPLQTSLQLIQKQNGENQSLHRVHMAETWNMASTASDTAGLELKFSILVSHYHIQKSD